jgi:hypothetical protein
MTYLNRTKLTDDTGVVVNPASDDTVILLRRIVKLLESNAVVDVNNRQKVAVEVMPTTTVTGTVTVSTITSVGQLAGVDSRFQIIDWARQAYNSGIRSNLVFT